MTGEASFLNAGEIKEFGKQMLTKGTRDFVVDLAECTQLDSTFMGTMAVSFSGCENTADPRATFGSFMSTLSTISSCVV